MYCNTILVLCFCQCGCQAFVVDQRLDIIVGEAKGIDIGNSQNEQGAEFVIWSLQFLSWFRTVECKLVYTISMKSMMVGVHNHIVLVIKTEEKVSDSDVDDAMKNVSLIPFLSETSKATKSKDGGKKKKKPKFTVDESPKRVTRSTPKTTEESEEDSEKEKSDEDEKEITDNEEEVIPQKQTRDSPKKPEKNETTTVYRNCRTRSSPKPLCDATSKLSNERKRCLKETGFETMINFPLNELPGSLGFYVLENFHPNSMELRLEKGSIKVTRQKVYDMLGVPMGSRKLDEMEPREWNDEFITRWEQQYYKLGKKEKATPALIAKEINRTSNADFMFKIYFLMLFASTMGTLDSGGKCPYNVLRNVKEDDDIADIDWCGYILDCLKGSKHNWKDVKKSGNYYYGPLTLLNLLYLDSTHFPKLQVMRHRPAIRRWNTAMMKQRIELEKKQKCLGKLEHHGEFNQEEDQSGCINLYQGADVYFEEDIEDETSPTTKEDYYRLVESSLDRISKERKEMLETLVEGSSDDDSDDENEDNSDNDEEENVEYENEEREDEKSENEKMKYEMEYEMLDSEKQVDDQMAVNEPAVDNIGVDEPKVQEVELVDETAVEEQKDQEPAVEQPVVEEHMPAVKEPAVEEPEKCRISHNTSHTKGDKEFSKKNSRNTTNAKGDKAIRKSIIHSTILLLWYGFEPIGLENRC
ncbi:hypothetical protein CTI12_AA530240 [Artemisia annua]|uniref:Uncharacterized protein n=1 Tax=Artemisia annua TaxID=35608 RepID=A0A2U1L5E8_ARTAN|nr:hypothetical protein CTI12_AA530240 [Artemisia annua]